MGLNVFLPLKKSNGSVHGDSFNSSGGLSVSDSSGGFNLSACGTDVGSSGSTRDFSRGTVGSVECVPTHQVPRGTLDCFV